MKVLFVLPGSENSSGPCKTMLRLANLIEADYFAFKDHSLDLSRYQLIKRFPRWFFDLVKKIRKGKYDFIITNSPTWLNWISIFFRKRSIIYLGGVPEEKKKTFKRLLLMDFPLHYALKHCRQIWYNDDPYVSKYALKYNKNSIFVKNAIDLTKFYPDEKMKLDTRIQLGLDTTDFVLGIVGPFDPFYNLPGLSWLLSHYKDLNKNIKIIVIGVSGFDLIRPNILYLKWLSEFEYANAIRAMDCLIVPRFVKTLCPQSKVLEAMACGTTVIQSNLATPPEGSINAKNIFVVQTPIGMINIANALSDELENRLECKYIGLAGRKIIEKYYDQKDTRNAMLSALYQLDLILALS